MQGNYLAMRLIDKYKKEAVPAMQKKFGYTNVQAVPKLIKAVMNVGFGKLSKEAKIVETVEQVVKAITGQRPLLTKAKKSISNFKVREGTVIGVKVTLRGRRLYDFLEKLVTVTLPRLRDFRGLSLKSFDQQGNLAIGFPEYLAFPEISAESLDKLFGLEVVIVTNAKTKEEAVELFKLLGFPLQKIESRK